MSEEVGFEVKLNTSYERAIGLVTEKLKAEGFGVLTKIDVQETLKKKISADFRPYVILGTCNPQLARRALIADPTIGLMLPCNVTIEATDDGNSIVRIVNPLFMMGIGKLKENPSMCPVAEEAHEKLTRVAEALSQ